MNIVGDLDRLVASFERHLKAENKAIKTVQTYRESVVALTSYLATAGDCQCAGDQVGATPSPPGPETAWPCCESGDDRSVGAVVDDPKLAKRIGTMRRKGMTYQAIADKLNADGVPTMRGGTHWRVSSVQAATGFVRPPTHWRPSELPKIVRRRDIKGAECP